MKFWEAMKALEEGKKVVCKSWSYTPFVSENKWPSRFDSAIADAIKHGAFLWEWELYEEPQQTYSFIEILPLLKEGKKFRKISWESKKYIRCYPENNIVRWDSGDALLLEIHLITSTDWIEVK